MLALFCNLSITVVVVLAVFVAVVTNHLQVVCGDSGNDKYDGHRQITEFVIDATGSISNTVQSTNDNNNIIINDDNNKHKVGRISEDAKNQLQKSRRNQKKEYTKIVVGTLRPKHLPEPIIFTDWYNKTTQLSLTTTVDNGVNEDYKEKTQLHSIQYAEGFVHLPKRIKRQLFGNTNDRQNDQFPLKLFMKKENSLIRKRIYEENWKEKKEQDESLKMKNKRKKNLGADVSFAVLSKMLNQSDVTKILKLLNDYNVSFFDDDPDTVDSMPTYEIFVNTPWIDNPDPATPKYREVAQQKERHSLRTKLQEILLPIIQNRIQPFIQSKFNNLCTGGDQGRNCVACYSLIRRYKSNERISHPPHNDGHAIVTAVTSLSDYEQDYRGGLYIVSPNANTIEHGNSNRTIDSKTVGGGRNDNIPKVHTSVSDNSLRRFLALNAGDTIVHTSALYHGVKVYNKRQHPELTQRWSWILWFHDVDGNGTDVKKCDSSDHSLNWYKDCAEREELLELDDDDDDDYDDDDVNRQKRMNHKNENYNDDTLYICQQIYATKVDRSEEKLYWNIKSAMNGGSLAAVKVAHFFFHQGQNFNLAKQFYNLAIQYDNDPDAHYGMVEILLYELNKNYKNMEQKKIKEALKAVVYHLELSSMGGNVLAMFNLGIAHTYGYGIYDNRNQPHINYTIAAEWFIESGLPEGYYVASFHAASTGTDKNKVLQQTYVDRAITLGYGTPWRQTMRQQTGSGRIANVDLNLPWPTTLDGRYPPKF